MSAENLPRSIIGINLKPEHDGLPLPNGTKELSLNKTTYVRAGSTFAEAGLNPPRFILSDIISQHCPEVPFFYPRSDPLAIYYHTQNHDLLLQILSERKAEISAFIEDYQKNPSR